MLKNAIRGWHFDSDNEVVNAAHTFSNSLSQEEFKKMINIKWAERMERYVRLGGRYFEKALLLVVIVKVILAMFEINIFLRKFFLLSFARGTLNSVYPNNCIF